MRPRLALGLATPSNTERVRFAVLLRTHTHHAAHHDSGAGFAQSLVLTLALLGFFAGLLARL
jgi:hypothetical protein